MRTLVLLAALLLVAFQARAQPLQETADQVPAQDQPEAEGQDQLLAEDQDQAGAEDQDMAITFTGDQHLTRRAPGTENAPFVEVCHCRLKCRTSHFGGISERPAGMCGMFFYRLTRCCRSFILPRLTASKNPLTTPSGV
ncbi:alpha-defensin 1-like [Molossus nigricans]